jgi:hypothetical protein
MNKFRLPSEILLLLFIAVAGIQVAHAIDYSQGAGDTGTFDQILQPVMKVYNLLKYIASAIAALVLLLAGITYITSAGDIGKREKAKNMMTFVALGLIVIWATPFVVNYLA